jgi:hypothetical protein
VLSREPYEHPAHTVVAYARHRTGVQLKDKWRNLVKFKHVSKAEAEALPNAPRNPIRSVYRSALTHTPPYEQEDVKPF